MRKTLQLLFALIALVALSANAATLAQAKDDGLIGERADGYLGLVLESAPADVRALVEEVNARRKAQYERIAKTNNITLEQVRALAGKKAIQKTSSGHYIKINGGWRRK